MKIEVLLQLAESQSISENGRRVAAALREAMLDWPTPNQGDFVEFRAELLAECGSLTYEQIEARVLRTDSATDAWKGESLSGLLRAWNGNHSQTLDEIMASLEAEALGKLTLPNNASQRTPSAPLT